MIHDAINEMNRKTKWMIMAVRAKYAIEGRCGCRNGMVLHFNSRRKRIGDIIYRYYAGLEYTPGSFLMSLIWSFYMGSTLTYS